MAILKLGPSDFKVDASHDIFKIEEKKNKKNIFVKTFVFLPALVKKTLGKILGKHVLNAQGISRKKLPILRDNFLKAVPSSKRGIIETADKVKLDAMEIKHPGNSLKLPQEQKWIIFLNGKNTAYEQNLENLADMCEATKANVLTANYRGVGFSEGSPSSAHDLVVDGEALVQYLLNKGVSPENILVEGWSLGGGVATQVAAYHQEKDHEMKLVNDRSFGTLAHAISKFSVSGLIFAPLMTAFDWKFNTVKCWKAIKENCKLLIIHKDDQIVKYQASLYKHLKNDAMTAADKKLKQQRKRRKGPKPLVKTHVQAYKPNQKIVLKDSFFGIQGKGAHIVVVTHSKQRQLYIQEVQRLLNIQP
ncbi:MAG: hypothetical protein CK425_06935 [Parachlamydia sp.]|nr:MAG: hypothetical protein CK425_06935 [Parachlamydia sp.]